MFLQTEIKVQKLYSSLFGSRLYGTQTPTSDLDWKHVVLPSIDDLLTAKKIENKVKKTNTAKNTRNGADDVDEEFIPLQVFARHFVEGQTYALELAFSVDGNHASQQFYHEVTGTPCLWADIHEVRPFMSFVRELRTQFLTSNIKAMMGYVVNQASLYSFKGERLNVTRELKALFEEFKVHFGTTGEKSSTDDFALAFDEELSVLAKKYTKYFHKGEYDIGGNRMKPCFIILEKVLPFTNSVEHSLKVLNTVENKYGARADQASESNVDWKATMHALRIVDEGIQLLTEKQLKFPFEQAYVDRLLSIKRGELPLDPIKEELSAKLDLLKDLEKSTDLPTCDAEFMVGFNDWLVKWLRKIYRLETV